MRWRSFLAPMAALLFLSAIGQAQEGSIGGTVVEGLSRRPLQGVSITILGADTASTTSNPEGQFTFSRVPVGSYTVRTRALGYLLAEQTVTVTAGATATASFSLNHAAVTLDEVVSIGYGSVQRRELTGSVATISQDELTKVPTANVLESMQGKLPGVDITRSNGSPNSGNSLQVRGTRSLTASNSPLVIIDGVQFGGLGDLNPGDIETIEVLKDAASTAIYGSRGANGVILVTTKRGTSGTNLSLNSYYGVTQITSYPAINSAEQYAALKREAYRTNDLWSSPDDDAAIFPSSEVAALNAGVSTDFRDLLFKDGRTSSQELSVMTGNDRTRAFISGGLYDESGIVVNDRMRRYAMRINLDHQVNDLLKVGTATQLTYYNRDRRNDPLNLANKITPLTAAYGDDGELILYPNGSSAINPLVDQQPNAFKDNELQSRVLPSLYGEFTKGGFDFKSTIGIDVSNSRRGTFASSNTIAQNGQASASTYSTNNSHNTSWENVATYRKDIGDHSLTVTGIGSYLSNKEDDATATGRNQLVPAQYFYNLGGASEGLAMASAYTESALLSSAGRINYDYQDKYLLSVAGRYDGSSRLSKGNEWAFFPAASAAWRLSQESFLSDVSWLDELKFRVGYGVTGNDAVSPYSTQATLVSIPMSFDETAAPGYTFSSRVGNTNLKWELSKTTNIGVDVALWNSRVSAAVDYYKTNTSDLLLARFLPQSSGVSSIVQNIGATQTHGFEFSLNTTNVQRGSLLWSTAFTYSRDHEKITSLVGGTDDVANNWFIGYAPSVYYDYQKIGIWQLGEEAEAASFGRVPGDIKVKDQNGDGSITPDDRIVLGSRRPKWSGSITNNVSWKGFDASATVFGRMGQLISYEFYNSYKPDGVENGAAVDYWTPENPTNAFPRPNSRFPKNAYPYYSTLTYADGSFIKLRDATIGYTLPPSLASHVSPRGQARVYFSGRNLTRWSKLANYDPERGGGLSSPMTRAFVTGIDIKF